MGMVYEFVNARFATSKVDADVVGETITRLARENAEKEGVPPEMGVCLPGDLVDEAIDPESPLHPLFDFDLERSARRDWHRQAQRIIVATRRVSEEEGGVPTPAFVHVGRVGYVAREVAMANTDWRAQLLRETVTGLKGWANRAGMLFELQEVWDVIRDLPDPPAPGTTSILEAALSEDEVAEEPQPAEV